MTEQAWLKDWQTIWRSELRALAEDPELCEAAQHVIDVAAGSAGAAPPARAAAAAVPPGDGRTSEDVGRLVRRVDELERRLATLGAAGRT